MERFIRFNKFRNLGFEKPDTLMLNADFIDGKKGNLLILIGSNNSGKSNILDGILKFRLDRQVEKRDVTDLSFDPEYKKPSLSLCFRDGDNYIEFEKRLNESGEWKANIDLKKEQVKVPKDVLLNELKNISMALIGTNLGVNIRFINQFIDRVNVLDNYDFDLIKNELFDVFNFYKNHNILQRIPVDNFQLLKIYYGHINELNIRKELEEKYKFDLLPNIYNYSDNELSNSDLFTDNINEISNHKFFKSLFKILKIDVTKVINAYNQYNNDGNIAILHKLNKSVKSKVDKLNEQFNKMYFTSNDKYKFSLDFGASRISFGMARGIEEDAIKLEYQSTGFRWFFDFFFNYLSTSELKSGDIVIMDEPATNLHPQGQIELRKFIKQYAIENDVLFIIATHSPFLIDIDNYDELRVVSMENNLAKIDNVFATIDLNDPVSLLPIKEALTIKQSMLYDLETEVYWVEGMSDYIYLTLFKNLLEKTNIAFLPFKGVGKTKEETHRILEKICDVKFHKKSLLVDADKAGMDMYNQAKKEAGFDGLHNLSELELTSGKKALNIEDLFSADDQKKYSFIKEKRSIVLSEFKIHSKLSDFSDETIANFKKLFEILED